jgi:hypothetical protein
MPECRSIRDTYDLAAAFKYGYLSTYTVKAVHIQSLFTDRSTVFRVEFIAYFRIDN